MFDIATLPAHLNERTRWFANTPEPDAAPDTGDRFVVYWMRTAVRGHENPAFDVAKSVASEFSLPLLVYQGLSPHYRFASDRHHTFMLEGARDVQQELRQQGISYAFHLQRQRDEPKHLLQLVDESFVLVTEEMPVGPPTRFLKRVASQCRTPILSVDTACVAPMLLTDKAFTRAFAFRSATKQIYQTRIGSAWPDVAALSQSVQNFPENSLPFKSLDLNSHSIPELVASCDIDHSIGPVTDTKGGSTAGYQRWDKFKSEGLKSYAKRRNNPLKRDGVSRMSAYLHYGMVSPMRLAREVHAIGGGGAEKYLDELLIWRELAYHFCFHRKDCESWAAVPDWARQTLERHQSDIREAVLSWEALARGETGDALWDAAQLSLLRQGELHNNVRMTWGKAILNWTSNPQEALEMMVDLNHRFALDGRDPASYGGLLWCLGQFDRPFEPETSILGTVRPRPTSTHAQRLSTEDYLKVVQQPRFEPCHVAVIGAGLSGLAAARTLSDHGVQVTVFDKSRGLGGRMSTRRVDGVPTFDHGAQYFTSKKPIFQRYVDSWQARGIVDVWEGRVVRLKQGATPEVCGGTTRYVGSPTMNSICKHLGRELEIRKQVRVENVHRDESGLYLDCDQNRFGPFHWVICSAPAEQSADLVTGLSPLETELRAIDMHRCWALMLSLEEEPDDLDWIAGEIADSFLVWVARNQTKPNRPDSYGDWVVHASPDWTVAHWETAAEEVAKKMLLELEFVLGSKLRTTHSAAHRWKFALSNSESGPDCYVDYRNQIVFCGDWCAGGQVEAAFISGLAAAGRVLGKRVPLSQSVATSKQTLLFDV